MLIFVKLLVNNSWLIIQPRDEAAGSRRRFNFNKINSSPPAGDSFQRSSDKSDQYDWNGSAGDLTLIKLNFPLTKIHSKMLGL